MIGRETRVKVAAGAMRFVSLDAPGSAEVGEQVQLVLQMSDADVFGNKIGSTLSEGAKAEIAKAITKVRARVEGGCGPLGLAAGFCRVAGKYLGDLCRPEPPSPFRGTTQGSRSLAWASVSRRDSVHRRADLDTERTLLARTGAAFASALRC